MGKSVRTKFLVWIMAVAFACSLLPAFALKTLADEPQPEAKPIDLTESASKTGKGWTWDKDSTTLTLTNFSLDLSESTENFDAAIKLPEKATVVLAGDNNEIKLKGTFTGSGSDPVAKVGIYGEGDLIILGTGRLDVDASDGADGICADGDLSLGIDETGVSLTVYGTESAIAASKSISTMYADIEAGAVSAYGVILVANDCPQGEEKPGTVLSVEESDLSIYAAGEDSNGLAAYYGDIALTNSSFNQVYVADASGTAGISAMNGSVSLNNTEVNVDLSEAESSVGIEAGHYDLNYALEKPGISISNGSTVNISSDESALYANYGGLSIDDSFVEATTQMYAADIGLGGATIANGSNVSLVSKGGYMSAGARIAGDLNVSGDSKLNCEGKGELGAGLLVDWESKAVFSGEGTQITLRGDQLAFQMSGDKTSYTENPLTLNDGLRELGGDNFLSVEEPQGDNLWSYTPDAALELTEYGGLANAATEVIIGVPVDMTINITGNHETVDYDGEEHTVEGFTVETDRPELFDQELLAVHARAKLIQTEPGRYTMDMEADDFSYDDPFVNAVIKIKEDGYLLIKAPEDGPAIKTQPKSAEVNYPGGASFFVEVKDPESVDSYQWLGTDGYHWFTLDGITAKEPKLVVPATSQDDPDMVYRCRITGKDGKITYSKPAMLSIRNKDVDMTVLYVGNYALRPGEGLDLSYTELGSGVISFDENGSDITLNNVQLDNEHMIYDSTLTSAMGLTLYRQNNQKTVYNFILKGVNTITNHFYQEQSNSGGIDFQVMMLGEDSYHPDIHIMGDGNLTLNGGSYGIYADGWVFLDSDVATTPNGDLFLDGIHADSITVSEGVQVDLDVNGGGLVAETDNGLALTQLQEGSAVRIKTSAPHVGGDSTQKFAVFTTSLYMTDAKLEIEANADPKQFVPYSQYVAMLGGIFNNVGGDMEINNSSIQIDMKAEESETPYIVNYYGIYSYYSNGMVFDHSNVAIKMNSDQITVANGIFGNCDLTINNSKVETDIQAGQKVYGIAPEGTLQITDSVVTNNVKCLVPGGTSYGVLCNNLDLSASNKDYTLKSTAEDGIAFAASTGVTGDAPKGFDPSYKAKQYKLSGAEIVTPAANVISTTSMQADDGKYLYLEAVYDQADTSAPATTIEIIGRNPISKANATLKYTKTVYSGKAKKPAVVVKCGSTTLKEGKDYTVAYSNNKKVGTATVTITGKGDYTGTLKKTFTIVPKGTSVKSVTGKKKALTVKWKKQKKQTTGYQLQYSTNSNFKYAKTITGKKNTTTGTTIKKLKSGKTYYVRIRTYKTVNGKKYYSSWSKAKKAAAK